MPSQHTLILMVDQFLYTDQAEGGGIIENTWSLSVAQFNGRDLLNMAATEQAVSVQPKKTTLF